MFVTYRLEIIKPGLDVSQRLRLYKASDDDDALLEHKWEDAA